MIPHLIGTPPNPSVVKRTLYLDEQPERHELKWYCEQCKTWSAEENQTVCNRCKGTVNDRQS